MSELMPLSVPSIQGNEWKYIKECLDTEWVSSAGKYVNLFEQNICEFTGVKNDEVRYIHNEIGYNFRLTNIQAAMGIAQLEQLQAFLEVKVKNLNYTRKKSIIYLVCTWQNLRAMRVIITGCIHCKLIRIFMEEIE